MHPFMHTYIQTYMHTYTHLHTRTDKPSHLAATKLHTYLQTCARTYVPACVNYTLNPGRRLLCQLLRLAHPHGLGQDLHRVGRFQSLDQRNLAVLHFACWDLVTLNSSSVLRAAG